MSWLQYGNDTTYLKIRGFCKADKATEKAPEPEQKKPITEYIVNDYMKQKPGTIFNYLRSERVMKAQRRQMNARSLSNNAKLFYFIVLTIIKDAV